MTDDADQVSPNDIAIVGMALRVPGASNVGQFWANLRGGVESIRDLTAEELAEAEAAGDQIHHSHYVRRTSDLPEMEMFDADFFGLSPKEAAIMDPQHRHFLECAWEAMEDAGRMPDTNGGPVGVFAGCGMGSYFYFNVCSNRELVDQVGMFLLRHTGNDKDFLSTRASFTFDLRGPSVNVQTACSTSLVAVHYAAQSLMSGECDMALAGGVTIDQPHRRGYLFQDGEILSPDGHCRAFDHRAAGTVFGSGVGVVVLRRLADALADGDVIHGVIKATAINNDGASKAGYLAPSVTGQAEAIIEAQGLAGIDADSVQYVECHGTGTYLGDPIEIEALTEAFRQSTRRKGFCRVGSVKSNIGHLDTAAGVVSLIKTTLALKHGEIPPTLGFEKPNPAIDFANSPFIVNDTLTPWPEVAGPRRAAVNSLGVGGTNAHVIVEQAPKVASAVAAGDDEMRLIVLSAKQKKGLDDAGLRLAAALSAPDLSLGDAAHTLHAGRRHFEHRQVVAVRGRDDAIAALTRPELKRAMRHAALESTSGAVFLFPGGGAQHPGMVLDLYKRDPAFRATVDEGLGYLSAAAATEIRAVWLDGAEGAQTAFLKPSVQLPAILIVEIAVARLWMSHGVEPTALIGHSMGENTAACLAGVLSYKDAVNLVRLRGELFDTIDKGGMLSVSLDAEALTAMLPPALDMASVNAPALCVVSGRDADLDAFRAELEAKGIDCSRIAIDIAAHSRMLESILPRFEAFLRSITLSPPRIPIISNRDGEMLSAADATDPMYWVRHLRNTVHFARGLATLAADNSRIYIEAGPSRALASLTKAQGSIDANQVINSLPHPDEVVDTQLHLMTAIGRAWAAGLPIDLSRLVGAGRRVSLPTYPFQHRRYFIERQAPAAATAETAAIHKVEDMGDWGYRPAWQRSLARYTSGAEKTPANWLVFLDNGDTGAALVARLRGLGHRVVTVAQGDSFARRDRDSYVVCAEDGRPGYDALLSGLSADGGVPDRIVHLWLTTHEEQFRPGSSFFHRNQESGFYSLFHLAQAIGDAGLAEPRFTVVANGMQRVADEAVPHPEKAMVLGPALVIPREMPGASVRVIDVDLATRSADREARGLLAALRPRTLAPTPQSLLDLLWEDLHADPSSEVVAYRGGQRWLRVHQRMALAPADTAALPFRDRGVYLVTGGLGDLALSMAGQLVDRFGARIVLMGRSPLPPRAEWNARINMLPRTDRQRRALEALIALEAGGAEIAYERGDVGNPDDVARVVALAQSRFGGLNGVLHAAGLVDDALMATKTDESVEAVLGPKVHGTAVLDRALAGIPLDLVVLFSSTSTDTAPAGQVDYVAANAFLNAYAESRAGVPGRRTVAVHWGIWNEIGLAARATGSGARTEAAAGLPQAAGPFFERWVEDAAGTRWLERAVGPQTLWMLDEHRLVSGQPILPGTGYLEIVAQAAREYGLADIAIEDLMFLRPLYVNDGATKLVRVRVEPSGEDYRVVVTASEGADAASGFHRHAEARLAVDAEPAATSGEAVTDARTRATAVTAAPAGQTLRAAQEDHIRFGARWKVLHRVAIGEGEAVADLELPARFAGDLDSGLLLHPALLDIATGFAMALIPGYDPADVLWAPVSYGRARVHRALPGRIRSWARRADASDLGPAYAAFDIVIVDDEDRVVFEAERFVVKRLEGDLGFAPVSDRPETASRAGADENQSPAMQQLAAQVRQGILPAEGFEAMLRAIVTGETQPIVSSMDLFALIQRAGHSAAPQATGSDGSFDRPDLESEFVAPRNEIETTLAGFWRELLGIEQIGVDDSFFDLGGHSLIAVRLFRMIRKAYDVDLPISVLFDAPTIALCAALIAEQAPAALAADGADGTRPAPQAAAAKPTHLVAMQAGPAGATPLFICAGMFGNVMNLRHLARHLGADRPVYGLQARGLYGEQPPHETFEEAAASCLAEIRAVQPHGPYLLAGFSGGGLTAYEIAQQLVAEGEEVSHLVLLDTPLPTQPPLTTADKVTMKLQDIRRDGFAFLANWLAGKIRWKAEQRRKQQIEDQPSESLHNNAIEAAFRRSLPRYAVRAYGGAVTLFRPRPAVHYRLGGGRRLNVDRDAILDDNGWTPYVAGLEVVEVPGDHDSMVLEPFVRVLSERMRARLHKRRAPSRRTDARQREAAE